MPSDNLRRINIAIGAILTTLVDEDAPVPEGLIYAALSSGGYSFGEFQTYRALLVEGGLAVLQDNMMGLTPRGEEVARQAQGFERAAHEARQEIAAAQAEGLPAVLPWGSQRHVR